MRLLEMTVTSGSNGRIVRSVRNSARNWYQNNSIVIGFKFLISLMQNEIWNFVEKYNDILEISRR